MKKITFAKIIPVMGPLKNKAVKRRPCKPMLLKPQRPAKKRGRWTY